MKTVGYVCMFIQVLLWPLFVHGGTWVFPFWVASMFSLLRFDNRIWSWFLGIAIFLNGAVTMSNGGYMPVAGTLTNDGIHIGLLPSHRLIFLADIIQFHGGMCSLGDLFLFGAGVLFVSDRFFKKHGVK